MMKKITIDFLDELPRFLAPDPEGNGRLVAMLDTEATGLDASTDELIEIGYVIVRYDSHDTLTEVIAERDYLGEPSEPLPRVIQLVTGLTDADLCGRRIPWDDVARDMEGVDIIVAHNAAFDRGFCEKYHDVFRRMAWADSMSQIDWLELAGVSSRTQEILALRAGEFVYQAHQALDDARALTYLLSRPRADNPSETYFHALMATHRKKTYMVVADGAPFAKKDALKNRKYRWDPVARSWGIMVAGDDAMQAEVEWLTALMYDGYRPIVTEIPITGRFRGQK